MAAMNFTLRIRGGVVLSCNSEIGAVPMALCEIGQAVSTIFDMMNGRQFDIEFVNV